MGKLSITLLRQHHTTENLSWVFESQIPNSASLQKHICNLHTSPIRFWSVGQWLVVSYLDIAIASLSFFWYFRLYRNQYACQTLIWIQNCSAWAKRNRFWSNATDFEWMICVESGAIFKIYLLKYLSQIDIKFRFLETNIKNQKFWHKPITVEKWKWNRRIS